MKDCYYSKYEPIFGSWHITEEIGSGAEGHLYRIRRTDSIGHEFYSALKAISIPGGGETELESMMAGGMSRDEVLNYYEDMLENTSHEFDMLAKLKGNSNIVSYEDHEIFKREDEFGWDILIRLEELTPLVSHSVYHPLDEEEVVKLGKDICRGLSLCRNYGVVHRDIKPDNIFISPSGSYKLGDFGIARIIEQTSVSLSRKGTYTYMAPEVYWGKDYDYTVDIYSLGMVMYRYLNDGRDPFMPVWPDPVEYGDRENAFIKRVNAHEMDPPRKGSKDLKNIVLKACEYEPENRYRTPDEMLADLEAIGSGRIVASRGSAGRTSAPVSAPKDAGYRRPFVALALLMVLMLIAFGIYVTIPKEVTDITGIEDGTKIYLGNELAPEYKVAPDWFKDEPISFTSSNNDIFSVDDNGVIHAVSLGSADLTLSAKEYDETVSIEIIPKVTSITGIDEAISLTTGNTLQLTPKLGPEEFANEPVTFSSSDDKVATVAEDGTVTAVSAGETVLTVSSGGCTFESKITVADPVVYRSYTSSSGSSGSKKSSGSSKASKGYFDSSDDEHF